MDGLSTQFEHEPPDSPLSRSWKGQRARGTGTETSSQIALTTPARINRDTPLVALSISLADNGVETQEPVMIMTDAEATKVLAQVK